MINRDEKVGTARQRDAREASILCKYALTEFAPCAVNSRMRGVTQPLKKSVKNLHLKGNVHLAIVADALGQERQRTFAKKNRNLNAVFEP